MLFGVIVRIPRSRRAITLVLLRPLGAAVPPIKHGLDWAQGARGTDKSTRSKGESAFDVAARQRADSIVSGCPEAARTALRHLAAEWARDSLARLYQIVLSLRDVLPLFATQHPFDAFIQAALLNCTVIGPAATCRRVATTGR